MSIEQKAIVDNALQNANLSISSVAGSGKTTTCLHICSQLSKKRVLLLTYNSRLKIESREKVKLLGLRNVEVHSYHAFCVKYYYDKGHRDDGIQKVISDNFPSKKPFSFDLIILDEQQDMTHLFYKFAIKIMNDNHVKDIQICSFGDIYQNIYTYAGSDARYLIYANKIFGKNSKNPWKTLNISTSYRVTRQIANFINTNMLKSERLKAIKNGPNVKYVIMDAFTDSYVYDEVMKYLKMDYLPDDIFVLGASLKKGKKDSPICLLENKLVYSNIPCHVSLSDDAKIDDDVIKGKVCFASFHQVKGMERKICIVYGFDESYFNYYAKDYPRDVCPNVLYVALTRASDRLLLVHDYNNNYLSFTDRDIIKTTSDVVIRKKFVGSYKPSSNSLSVAVRDLIKNLSNDTLNYLFNYVKYEIINPPNKPQIQLQSKVTTKNDLFEDVSDINGLAIPAIYEYKNTKSISMLEQIVKSLHGYHQIGINEDIRLPDTHRKAILDIYAKYKGGVTRNSEVLYISNVYNSLLTGFIGKREQINKYDWLAQKPLEDALEILKKIISTNAQYEKRISVGVNNKIVVGTIDCIDNNTIWELKCVSGLSREHILQLVLYSYLNEKHMMYERDIREIDEMKKYTEDLENKKVGELTKMCKIYEIDLHKQFDVTLSNSKKVKKNKAELVMSLIDFKQLDIERDIITKNKSVYKLLNILSNEIIEVKYDEDYQIIIEFLLNKNAQTKKDTDDEFIRKCLSIVKSTEVDHNNNDNNGDNDNSQEEVIEGYCFV